MRSKPVILRELAHQDVDDAVSWYLEEAGQHVALNFIAALEKAYAHIGRHASTGSPRYGHELDLPDLRMWPVQQFPWLIFYIERSDHIDVWRVLHSQHDIPAWLSAQ